MSMASVSDVEDLLGRSLSEAEQARATTLLRRADALILGYLGCKALPDPAPEALVDTAASMVARVIASAASTGVDTLQIDDGMVRYTANASGGDLWLSAADKLSLRPYRCGGGLISVQLVGERYSITPEP